MKNYKRRNYFIDRKLQTKYIIVTLLLLLVYTALFVVILFTPYIIPLQMDYSLEEQSRAARMLLALHKSVWPALGLVIVIMSGLSIFVTHRVAGPVYRLRKALSEVAAGNLNFTIKLRKNDDLQDLAADMNLVVEELREFVKTLKDDHETLSVCIGDLEKQIENRSISAESGRELIDKMETSRKMIALTLDKYSLQ